MPGSRSRQPANTVSPGCLEHGRGREPRIARDLGQISGDQDIEAPQLVYRNRLVRRTFYPGRICQSHTCLLVDPAFGPLVPLDVHDFKRRSLVVAGVVARRDYHEPAEAETQRTEPLRCA